MNLLLLVFCLGLSSVRAAPTVAEVGRAISSFDNHPPEVSAREAKELRQLSFADRTAYFHRMVEIRGRALPKGAKEEWFGQVEELERDLITVEDAKPFPLKVDASDLGQVRAHIHVSHVRTLEFYAALFYQLEMALVRGFATNLIGGSRVGVLSFVYREEHNLYLAMRQAISAEWFFLHYIDLENCRYGLPEQAERAENAEFDRETYLEEERVRADFDIAHVRQLVAHQRQRAAGEASYECEVALRAEERFDEIPDTRNAFRWRPRPRLRPKHLP